MFMLIIGYLHSQQLNKLISGIDTLDFYNFKIVIKIPKPSNKYKFNYEEGMIYTYTSCEDTALIIVFFGSNATVEMFSGHQDYLYTDEIDFNNCYKDVRGYRIINNQTKLYFRKIEVNIHYLMISYQNVKEGDVYLYDSAFNNLKYIRIH